MPRVSREVSDRHKEEIEIASAKLFREHGINGISVANLMAAAGLTHGSFYSHFESKDELAALACTRSFEQSTRQWRSMLRDADAPGNLDKIVRRYLRDANVTGPVADCPAASLAGDVAREPDDRRVRQAFADGVNELAATLQGALEKSSQEPRRDSLTLLSTLVGSLLLARATAGTELSAEIQQGAIARIGEDYE